MHKEFETERLLIRPTLEEDAELIYHLMNTPKFIKYVGDRAIHSIEDAENYIQLKMRPQLNALGYSSYTLILRAEGLKVGTCGLFNRDGVDGIDIGFGLLPHYEGFGYAYEAALRVLHAAFNEFDIEEIKAITSKENISSQRLLKKLGLKIIGTTKLPYENHELLLYQKRNSSHTKNKGH